MPKTSRPKRKCSRTLGHPSRSLHNHPLSPHYAQQGGNASLPIHARHQGPRPSRPVSRPKVKCTFGPRAKLRCDGHIRPPSSEDCLPLSPPSFPGQITPEPPDATTTWPLDLPPLPPATFFNTDRVTFSHDERERRTPFDRYKATCAPAPASNPLRPAHLRLGVSEEAFAVAVSLEIDELLTEIEATRRLELLEELPLERCLSKEDCLRMFASGELSATGSLAGVYRWAANIDLDTDDVLQTND